MANRNIINNNCNHKNNINLDYIYNQFNTNILKQGERMEYFKMIYIRFQQLKKQIWSHYLMLIGWLNIIIICNYLLLNPNDKELLFPMLIIIIYYTIIPFLIIFLIELLCQNHISNNFILCNKIYNIIWTVGFISGIILYFCPILLISKINTFQF